MLWLPAVFLKLTMAALFVAALLTDRIGKKKGALFMAEETKRGGAPQEALLELRHIRKVFNAGTVSEMEVFHDFSLTIHKG